MNSQFKAKLIKTTALAVFGLGLMMQQACSKKETATEGDVAGDAAVAAPTPTPTELAGGDFQAGAPIADLRAVTFGFDSFALSGEAKAALDAHAEWIKGRTGVNVQIEGHCDERGTTEYNLALGERRAGVVKDYLISRGVDASRLATISYGEERPTDPGHDETAWAKNRRAEFVSLGR